MMAPAQPMMAPAQPMMMTQSAVVAQPVIMSAPAPATQTVVVQQRGGCGFPCEGGVYRTEFNWVLIILGFFLLWTIFGLVLMILGFANAKKRCSRCNMAVDQ